MRNIAMQRLLLFMLSVVLASIGHTDGLAQTRAVPEGPAVVKKYPPYPDIWGVEGVVPSFCEAEDGEFYTMSSPSARPGESLDTWKAIAFFGKSTREIPSQIADSAWRSEDPLPHVGMLRCFGMFNHKDNRKYEHPSSLELPDGVTIRTACIGSDRFGRSCGYPYFGNGFDARDRNGRIVAQKTLVHIPRYPQHRYLPAPQISEDGGEIVERAIYLEPDLVPLMDGTFLVKTRRGVFRFDSQLHTRFQFKRQEVFLVETKLLDAVYERLFGPNGGPATVSDFQALQDAVVDLLSKLQKETKP